MSEQHPESIFYNKYEVQSLLGNDYASEFKLERIFSLYKQPGGKQFFYNILKTIELPDDVIKTNYTTYFAKPTDAWTLISHRFYNRTDLWWLIALLNNINDTFSPIEPGLALKIPKPDYVRMILDAIKAQL